MSILLPTGFVTSSKKRSNFFQKLQFNFFQQFLGEGAGHLMEGAKPSPPGCSFGHNEVKYINIDSQFKYTFYIG